MRLLLILLILGLWVWKGDAVYGRVPGERYQSFLRALNETQKAEAKKIIYDLNTSRKKIVEAVRKYAQSQSPALEVEFNRSELEYERRLAEMDKERDIRVANMSLAAKEVDDHIRSIYRNYDLTEKQTCEMVSTTVAGNTDVVQAELGLWAVDCDMVFEKLQNETKTTTPTTTTTTIPPATTKPTTVPPNLTTTLGVVAEKSTRADNKTIPPS